MSGVELTVTYDADGAPILEHDFDYEEAVAPYEAPEQPWWCVKAEAHDVFLNQDHPEVAAAGLVREMERKRRETEATWRRRQEIKERVQMLETLARIEKEEAEK